MQTLRLRGAGTEAGHGGEVFSCLYTSDGAFVLSAGWDGFLRLCQASNGSPVSSLQASTKPLSCCAFSPDGSSWLSGSMDGVLSWWDPLTHQPKNNFIAHIRPISAVQFSPDGRYLATCSWDRKLVLRPVGNEHEGQILAGHHDIVAGCRWTADSKQLLSWSHDGTLRLWEVETRREATRLVGHSDRVTAACLSHDGKWAVSGSRDGTIKLWDLGDKCQARSVSLNAEVRGCWCAGDDASVLVVNADGWMVLWSLPGFEVLAELSTSIRPMCGDLSPHGTDVVLGDENGRLHFIAIEGGEDAPLLVKPTPTATKTKSSVFSRFLGKDAGTGYEYVCPVCRHAAELASWPREAIHCPSCKRLLRIATETPELQVQN